MVRYVVFSIVLFQFHFALARVEIDTVDWIAIKTDSGIVHAAIAIPEGVGPFPAVIILHGTHGFAKEYVRLASELAKNGIVGIAACWFRGRRGSGERFITKIDFDDAPPFVDVAGLDRFRIARYSIDMLLQYVKAFPYVKKNAVTLFGHSRGAGASLDYALSYPGKVQGLVLNSCGYPKEVVARAVELTIPIIILHGIYDSAADGGSPMTSVSMAREFEKQLYGLGKDVEAKYFESGHNALFSSTDQFQATILILSNFAKRRF